MKQLDTDPGSNLAVYQIKVRGKLDERWSEWFGEMRITVRSKSDAGPITTLIVAAPDQPALRGMLTKIWDLNLTLISVFRIERDQCSNVRR